MIETSVKRFSKITGLPLTQTETAPAPVEYVLTRSKYKSPSSELYLMMESVSEYKFSATDEEFIAVLSSVSTGNALALLNHGLRSCQQVEDFLRSKDWSSLLRNRRNLGDAALESGLSPLHFMEFMSCADTKAKNERSAADAVRAFALDKASNPDLGYYSSLAQSVLSGEMRYEDIIAIGATMIRRHFDLEELGSRLCDLAWSPVPLDFEAVHLRMVIDQRIEDGMESEPADSRLRLMGYYGGDFSLSLKNPVKLRHAIYAEWTREEALGYIPYADAVLSISPDLNTRMSDFAILKNAGIPMELAAAGLQEGRSAQQIVAMSEGVEPALTEGWL